MEEGEDRTDRARFTRLAVNGHWLRFNIDSGAEVTVVPDDLPWVPELLDPEDVCLTGPGGHALRVRGSFPATLTWKEKTVQQKVYVLSALSTPLLGLPAIEALGVVKFVEGVSTVKCKLFEGLGTLHEEYTIRLKPGAVPFSLSVPRRVPIPLQKAVKEELDRLEKDGVIRRVNDPTPWCAGMVVVPKPSGKYRICVDLTKLNQSVLRERHILPTVDQVLGQLGEAKVFSKLDATSGFHQVQLAKESQELTTFITPAGRYCYQRLPFGLTSAPEYFQRQISRILEGQEGVVNMIDDVLVFGADKRQHDERLQQVLDRLERAGVTLNREKCEFGVTTVKFLGVLVKPDGIYPDPSKVQAITEMAPPQDVSAVRRFLGMVNHVGRFLPNVSQVTAPIRALLGKAVAWMWGPEQQHAFEQLKALLTSGQGVAKYHPEYPTIVSADASSYGLGAVLIQQQPSGDRLPVAYASRSLTETEQRYSQLEKEALAAAWAVTRFDEYVRGLHFLLETDHRPLLELLGSKGLDVLPPRIQRFRMMLMRYQYEILHVPGKLLATADTLSRVPVDGPGVRSVETIELFEQEVLNIVHQVLPLSLQEVRDSQKVDGECVSVREYVEKGWPQQKKVPVHLRKFLAHRNDLSVVEDILLRRHGIVVPAALQKRVLQLVHEGHQGIVRCKSRAQDIVWWPGINDHIQTLVSNCEACAGTRVLPREPCDSTIAPDQPWRMVGMDLFHLKGQEYLLVVDYTSRFPEVLALKNTSAASVVNACKSVFARFGIPEVVRSDNGPQFGSREFHSFAYTYGFQHITSSPRYPQSNGEVERMVRTVKDLLWKSSDPFLALMVYRDTVGASGFSPAQLLMGRKLRTRLPALPSKLRPRWPPWGRVKRSEMRCKRRQSEDYNRRHRVRPLLPLEPGQAVWVTDINRRGTVLSPAHRPRSYSVAVDTGVIERNRRHLVPYERDGQVSLDSPSACVTQDRVSSSTPTEMEEENNEGGNEQMLPPRGTPLARAEAERPVRISRFGRVIRPPRRLDL